MRDRGQGLCGAEGDPTLDACLDHAGVPLADGRIPRAQMALWLELAALVWNASVVDARTGTTEEVDRLRSTAEALGVAGAVRFTGAVPYGDVPACYRAVDVFVFPTLCREGQARSGLEALSSGLPSVTSDRPEARETYRDDEVLFVLDANVAGAFVDPLVSLLKDPGRRKTLGAAARAAAVERFSERDRIASLERWLRDQLRLVPYKPSESG